MNGPFIGEVLLDMGVLSTADIERILHVQRRTRQKFGQIAVRLGLAVPEQVWEAWAVQLARRQGLTLSEIGTDTAALERVSPVQARCLGIVPLRLWGPHLVVAAGRQLPAEAVETLARQTRCHVHVCVSDDASIRHHLERLAS